MLVVSLVGFADATYLTAKHYSKTPIVCVLLEGCEQVTTSRYAIVYGVPVALGGAIYYLVILLGAILYLDTREDKVLYGVALLTPLGFLASLWFLYVQMFILHAWCVYCLASAFTSIVLFALGCTVYKMKPNILHMNSGIPPTQ